MYQPGGMDISLAAIMSTALIIRRILFLFTLSENLKAYPCILRPKFCCEDTSPFALSARKALSLSQAAGSRTVSVCCSNLCDYDHSTDAPFL